MEGECLSPASFPQRGELSTFHVYKTQTKPKPRCWELWITLNLGLRFLFFRILFCAHHTGNQYSLSQLYSAEAPLDSTLTAQGVKENRAAGGFKCFKNAGVKLRDSLAQFQHKEALVRKERIQVQAQTLEPALQLTNTHIFHYPWAQQQLGEMGFFLLCSAMPWCFLMQKDPESEITQPDIGRWSSSWECASNAVISSAFLFSALWIKPSCRDNRSLSSSLHLNLSAIQQGTCSL